MTYKFGSLLSFVYGKKQRPGQVGGWKNDRKPLLLVFYDDGEKYIEGINTNYLSKWYIKRLKTLLRIFPGIDGRQFYHIVQKTAWYALGKGYRKYIRSSLKSASVKEIREFYGRVLKEDVSANWYVISMWVSLDRHARPSYRAAVWGRSKEDAKSRFKRHLPIDGIKNMSVIDIDAESIGDILSMYRGTDIKIDFAMDRNGKVYIGEKEMRSIKESFKAHYPSLKKITQIHYTDPRLSKDLKNNIRLEKEGNFLKDKKLLKGHYMVYETDGFYVGVHVSEDINEESGEPHINIVALDKKYKNVRERVAYRARRCKNEQKIEEEG